MRIVKLFFGLFLLLTCTKNFAFEYVRPEDLQVVVQTLRDQLQEFEGRGTEQAVYAVYVPVCSNVESIVNCSFINSYTLETTTLSESEFSDTAFDFGSMLTRISPKEEISYLQCTFNDLKRSLANSICWFETAGN